MSNYDTQLSTWGIFTLELARTVMYKSDLKNYELLISYAKLVNAPIDVVNLYENKIILLTEKIDYIYSILDKTHWRNKELLIRCYVKKYSNKMAGRKFNMNGKQVNERISGHIRKYLVPLIDINKLK